MSSSNTTIDFMSQRFDNKYSQQKTNIIYYHISKKHLQFKTINEVNSL